MVAGESHSPAGQFNMKIHLAYNRSYPSAMRFCVPRRRCVTRRAALWPLLDRCESLQSSCAVWQAFDRPHHVKTISRRGIVNRNSHTLGLQGLLHGPFLDRRQQRCAIPTSLPIRSQRARASIPTLGHSSQRRQTPVPALRRRRPPKPAHGIHILRPRQSRWTRRHLPSKQWPPSISSLSLLLERKWSPSRYTHPGRASAGTSAKEGPQGRMARQASHEPLLSCFAHICIRPQPKSNTIIACQRLLIVPYHLVQCIPIRLSRPCPPTPGSPSARSRNRLLV